MGESLPLKKDMIYLPNFIQENGGPRVGERFEMSMYGVDLDFTVAGATEEILMGAALNTIHRFYVSDETFDELARRMPEGRLTMLTLRLEDYNNADIFRSDFGQDMPQDGVMTTVSYLSARQARTTMSLVVAVFIAAFAVVLIIVCLIVVRFRINTDIEESMINIGAQKAVGYKSSQIVSSIVLQFGVITLIGGVAGMLIGQALVPVIANILRAQIALVWQPGFNAKSAAISLALVLATVLLITALSARRIKKLHPLTALRGGLSTHSFKKNALPLSRARGPLSLLLALKQLAQNKKQAVMTGVIMAAVSVAAVMCITLYYSMNVNAEGFVRGFFGEVADASFILKDSKDGEAFVQNMERHDNVRKIFGFEDSTFALKIDGTDNHPSAVEDCAMLEGNMLLEGVYPRHDNEIALGAPAARVLEKGAGDMVTVECDGNGIEKQYMVTGVVQYTSHNGFNGVITGEGLRRLKPDFAFTGYAVYVENGVDADAFIEDVKRAEGDIFMSAGSPFENVGGMISSMGGILTIVAAGIVAATVCVVILALFMLIKTTILRRRRELGIQKALGFTTPQLMNQIALGLTPPIFAGIIAGAVIGCVGFNPMLAAMMSSLGIVKASLPIPMDWLLVACAALAALTYAISLLIAYRIRRISAYALVSE